MFKIRETFTTSEYPSKRPPDEIYKTTKSQERCNERHFTPNDTQAGILLLDLAGATVVTTVIYCETTLK